MTAPKPFDLPLDCLVEIISWFNKLETIPLLYVNKFWLRACQLANGIEWQAKSPIDQTVKKNPHLALKEENFIEYCLVHSHFDLVEWGTQKGHKGTISMWFYACAAGEEGFEWAKKNDMTLPTSFWQYTWMLSKSGEFGNFDAIEFLLKEKVQFLTSEDFESWSVHDTKIYLRKALERSAVGRKVDCFKRICELMYRMGFREREGDTHDHDAMLREILHGGSVEILDFYLQKINGPINMRQVNLSDCIQGGSIDMLNELIKKGGIMNKTTSGRYIETAVTFGKLDMVKHLRSIGCDWNEEAPKLATKYGYPHIMDWLLRNGCPFDDYTILYCMNWCQFKWMDVFKTRECQWNNTLACEASRRGIEMLKLVVSLGCPVDHLAYIPSISNIDCLKFLLDSNIPYNEYNLYEEVLKREGSIECVQLLMEKMIPYDPQQLLLLAEIHRRRDVTKILKKKSKKKFLIW